MYYGPYDVVQADPGPELWLPIMEYEGAYSISSHGCVRSEERVIMRTGQNPLPHGQRYMRVNVTPRTGRCFVILSKRSRTQRHNVHELVLNAFQGPCPAGMRPCHLDDDMTNNTLVNLRWIESSNTRVDSQPKSIGADYQFAQEILGYGHQRAVDWLAQGYERDTDTILQNLRRAGVRWIEHLEPQSVTC